MKRDEERIANGEERRQQYLIHDTTEDDRTVRWDLVCRGHPLESAKVQRSETRHRLATDAFVRVRSLLAGLHHEYSLTPVAA